HVLAVLALGLEHSALEVDVASARERLLTGWHLRAVDVDLDIVEALAVRLLHAREGRDRESSIALLPSRRGPHREIDFEPSARGSSRRRVRGALWIEWRWELQRIRRLRYVVGVRKLAGDAL